MISHHHETTLDLPTANRRNIVTGSTKDLSVQKRPMSQQSMSPVHHVTQVTNPSLGMLTSHFNASDENHLYNSHSYSKDPAQHGQGKPPIRPVIVSEPSRDEYTHDRLETRMNTETRQVTLGNTIGRPVVMV